MLESTAVIPIVREFPETCGTCFGLKLTLASGATALGSVVECALAALNCLTIHGATLIYQTDPVLRFNTFSRLLTSDKLTPELNDNNFVRPESSEEQPTNASEILLVEGEDYYLENSLCVFTSSFLLRRGYCCDSGCRNCPYPKESNE